MSKQVDQDFFRTLILHSLNYAPVLLEEALDEPDFKTLRVMKSTINFIRSDYYSWFLILISRIPPNGWKEETLKAQLSCINLKDKNEEFLLSCSFMVQVVHFVVMRDGCFRYLDVAASCLSEVYYEKYRGTFSNTDEWNSFERYCEATLQQKRRFLRDESTSDKPGPPSKKRDIGVFWNNTENTIILYSCSVINKRLTGSVGEDTLPDDFFYPRYLKLRIRMIPHLTRTWEADITDEIKAVSRATADEGFSKNPNCPKPEIKLCFGCVLTKSYAEMEESKVLYFETQGRLDRKDNGSEMESTHESGNRTQLVKKNSQNVEIGSSIVPSKNKLISSIKAIKNVFIWGLIFLNRMILNSWLIIPKFLKSKTYSLLQLFFYTIRRVFGWASILYNDSRANPLNFDHREECASTLEDSMANLPTLDHKRECVLTLEDDSISKSATLDHMGENASTLEDYSVYNSATLDHMGENASTLEDYSLSNSATLDHMEESASTLSTLEDDSIFKAAILDHMEEIASILEDNFRPDLPILELIGEYGLTLEDDFIPFSKTLDNGLKEYPLTLDCSIENQESPQLLNLVTEHPLTQENDSPSLAQKLSTEKCSDSANESIEPSSTVDKADLKVSYEPLEPLFIENMLHKIQVILNWIQGHYLINGNFNREDDKSFLSEICPYCNAECYGILFDSFDKYNKRAFEKKIPES